MGVLARQLAQREARRCSVASATSLAVDSVATIDPALPLSVVSDMIVGGDPALILRAPDLFLAESSDYPDLTGAIRRFLRWRREARPELRDVESAICLGAPWSSNYWHWMMERAPKAALAESAGFDGFYLVPSAPFAAESLRRMGVASERILDLGGALWAVKRLLVAPKLEGKAIGAHPALLDRLRASLRPQAAGPATRRIYLSRNQGPASRRLVNETAFKAVIDRFGFEEVFPERLSLDQQIALFSEAEAVIGPHGAAFTNILFMPENALVLEMFAPGYIQPVMLPVIRRWRHRYHQVLPHLSDAKRGYLHGDQIEAPLDLIETLLANGLSR